jgi:hypothetical protein
LALQSVCSHIVTITAGASCDSTFYWDFWRTNAGVPTGRTAVKILTYNERAERLRSRRITPLIAQAGTVGSRSNR